MLDFRIYIHVNPSPTEFLELSGTTKLDTLSEYLTVIGIQKFSGHYNSLRPHHASDYKFYDC